MKNYRGKLRGMKRLGLVERRREEERALQGFIAADEKLKSENGTILDDIGRVYGETRAAFDYEMILDYLRTSVNLVGYAFTVNDAALERLKPDLEREPAYMDRNFAQTKQRLLLSLRNFYEPTDKAVFKELLLRASKLKAGNRIKALDELFQGDLGEGDIDAYLNKVYETTRMKEAKHVEGLLAQTPEELAADRDPFLGLVRAIYPAVLEVREKQKARRGALDPLYARLSDVKGLYLGKSFIPDANSTLRLTYGRIKGYSPADAVYYEPFTALRGVLEKTTGTEPFDTPAALFDLSKARDFGAFKHPKLDDIPVCMLYDTDTTGGNSGSPVINARGELAGVNFDRTYEATINDYAWSEEYSRSNRGRYPVCPVGHPEVRPGGFPAPRDGCELTNADIRADPSLSSLTRDWKI
jgi:hypothetical protein